jgi:hypothetical protein
MDTCVNNLLTTVSTNAATDYPPTASLGALYYNSTDLWGWADGYHVMQTPADYNNCEDTDGDGICNPKVGERCLIATIDGSGSYYWDSYSCEDSHVNFMCEYTCNPNVDPVPDGDWPPADCWWCDQDRDGKMQQMVGFIGNTSSDPTIYVQEQNMNVHKLDLPKKSDGSNPIFPYIAYNNASGSFEVVGSFNQDTLITPNGDGNGSYHYYVDFTNKQTKVSNSNYDARSYASFVYVPDVQGTIFVGGYPPNVDDDYNYQRVMSRPMIYAQTTSNNRFTLPTSWPSNYYCNNQKCQILSFPQTAYHSDQLFVVGGSSYAYCPQPALGATGNIWGLRFEPSFQDTGNELQWKTYTNLNTPYGTCRGVMSFTSIQNTLLTTTLNYVDTQTSFTGFEAINYYANESYPQTSATAFSMGNDMPVQFSTLATSGSAVQTWSVMGGAMRNLSNNIATISSSNKNGGFIEGPTPNFPSSLYSIQLLGTTLSNQYPAPIYN